MEKEIKTVQDYLMSILPYRIFECPCSCLVTKFPSLLFRGRRQSPKDSRARLVASIGEKWHGGQPECEKKVLKNIQRKVTDSKPDMRLNDWDALALARHHGIKTRYLDWSSNCLIALWFSVSCRDGNEDKDGVESEVWVLQTRKEDFDIPADEIMPIPNAANGKGSQTKLFEPTPTDRRIGAQDSYMMRQVYEPKDEKSDSKIVSVERNELFMGRCWRVPITDKAEIRKELRIELEKCGYAKDTIFPKDSDFREIFSDEFVSECNNMLTQN